MTMVIRTLLLYQRLPPLAGLAGGEAERVIRRWVAAEHANRYTKANGRLVALDDVHLCRLGMMGLVTFSLLRFTQRPKNSVIGLVGLSTRVHNS